MWWSTQKVMVALVHCWLLILTLASHVSAQETPEFVLRYRVLRKEAEVTLRPIRDKAERDFKAAASTADREKISEEIAAKSAAIMTTAAQKILDITRPHVDEAAAVEPLVWVVRARCRDPIGHSAAELLIQKHLARPETIELADSMKQSGGDWVEPMLRAQIAANEFSAEQNCRVTLALAKCLQWQAELSRRLGDATQEDLRQIERNYGKEFVVQQRRVDPAKLEEEAMRLLLTASTEHTDLRLSRGGPTVAEIAKATLFEIEFLAIGKRIPELEGEDLEGIALKLSEYRGKVVMLSYWATWCAPCMALIPHECELVELYKDKPFVLLGVNSDHDKRKVEPVLKDYKIKWRSFWCGPEGPEGLIAKSWNINNWPTIFIVDHNGVIRGKNLNGAALDAKIAALVSEAEKAAKAGSD